MCRDNNSEKYLPIVTVKQEEKKSRSRNATTETFLTPILGLDGWPIEEHHMPSSDKLKIQSALKK